MTIWATRSWSESDASVLSTHRLWSGRRGSFGDSGPLATAGSGGTDDDAGEWSRPHDVMPTATTKMSQVRRWVMARIYRRSAVAVSRRCWRREKLCSHPATRLWCPANTIDVAEGQARVRMASDSRLQNIVKVRLMVRAAACRVLYSSGHAVCKAHRSTKRVCWPHDLPTHPMPGPSSAFEESE